MERRKMISSLTTRWVITRAPPDLPLPLLIIARRILKQLWPMEVPFSGSSFNSFTSV